MVDLDSNPTKLIEIVEVGKQLLITRGALTTFSIANDVAKYFAILPAMFAFTYADGPASAARSTTSTSWPSARRSSAIISAIIFNALIIPALVPLALRGVKYRAIGATALLRRNLLIYGLGGVILPFIGIKLIDLARPQPVRRVSAAVACGHAGPLPHPARGGAGRRQDLPHAPGGPAGARRGARRRDRLPRAARPARRRPRSPKGSSRCRGCAPARRRSSSRRSTSTRSSGERPSSRSSTSSRTRTRPGRGTRSATRTSQEILAAGIDVISTVNVQHLESQNDAIFELTGVRVRETFPDQILDDADEVVLVDLSPEALQERLRAGKVYQQDRIETALVNFFRRENLAALRELALREVAEDVGQRRGTDVLDPISAQCRQRADPRAHRAAAEVAADPPSGVALVAAARRRHRRALGAPARPAARGRRGDPARGASAARLHPRRPLPRGGGRRPRRHRASRRARARLDVHLRRHARREPRREIAKGSLLSRLVRELPGLDIRVVADRSKRKEAAR